MRVVVLLPVLDRPHRVAPLLANLRASQAEVELDPLFICSPGDDAEIEAVRATGLNRLIVNWKPGRGDYARKINFAADISHGEEWFFLGADDLAFRKGWADEALRIAAHEGKRVIGTNDLGNPSVIRGTHSTHSLVARSYIEELGTADVRGEVLHPGYSHQFVDNELVETARYRGEWTTATGAIVEHLHPHWQKAEMDATYRKALADRQADQRLFLRRRRLWTPRPAHAQRTARGRGPRRAGRP